ncbi:TKL protein kinase [Aphanomyces astaci]|uniref:TKL protein kinase n=1 Tax=Aphanomyces astaci TaxID=112090 RepID=W4FWG6_APHAT|nr:TKL protein kinase [Aphanomyces astaci]ETV71281.1 TKL protein kinase [Aphanomyces astaci]|eukprot:XP_009839221.1 TKL protein kinase [Aphanomyces astaci]
MAAIECFSAANFVGPAVVLPPMLNITDVTAWKAPCAFRSWRVPAGLALFAFPLVNFNGIPVRVDSTSSTLPAGFNVLSFAVIDRADDVHLLVDTGDTTFAPVVVPVGARLPVIDNNMDMRMSSMHIPPNAVVVGYKRRYFLGPYRVYSGSLGSLGDWNNRVRSLQVLPSTFPLPAQPRSPRPLGNATASVRFFARPNFTLLSLQQSVADGGVPSMEDWPFDLTDIQPSSITLDPGVLFVQYSATNFKGTARTWTTSTAMMPTDHKTFLMQSFQVLPSAAAQPPLPSSDYAMCISPLPASSLLYLEAGDVIPDLSVFNIDTCRSLVLPPSIVAIVYTGVNSTGQAVTLAPSTTHYDVAFSRGSLVLLSSTTTSSSTTTTTTAPSSGVTTILRHDNDSIWAADTMWIAFAVLVVVAIIAYCVFRQTSVDDISQPVVASPQPIDLDLPNHIPNPPTSYIPIDPALLDWTDLALYRLDNKLVLRRHFLASGASGDVYAGVFHNQPVAIKQLHVYTATSVQRFIREISLVAAIQSPHIVRLIGATWTCPQDLNAVMELMGGGDLRAFLAATTRCHVTWTTRLQWATSVCEGLFYLHSMHHMHRDIKSRNLLFQTKNDLDILKVADFGSARDVQDTGGSGTTTMAGTLRWMAPEMLLFQPYSSAVDVYAFGVVLSEMDTHETPYAQHCNQQGDEMMLIRRVLHDQLRPSFSADVPVWFKFLALRCMAHDPAERPSTSEILHVLLTQQRRLEERDDQVQNWTTTM